MGAGHLSGMSAYLTPAVLRRLCLSSGLFQDSSFDAGAIGDVTASGAGLGTLRAARESRPWDAFAVRVECVTGGELNDDVAPNPGQQPTFRVSLDGQSYDLPREPDRAGQVVSLQGGFSLQLRNGTAGAPVTLGTGDAALVVTPRRAGASLQVSVGSALGLQGAATGSLILTVTNTTTAAQAAAYVATQSAAGTWISVAAGGDGSGTVQAAGRTALPFVSFPAGALWSFSTAASPDLIDAIEVASAIADGYFAAVWRLPLSGWGKDVEQRVGELARWHLLTKRGMDPGQDVGRFDPMARTGGPGTYRWLQDVAAGLVRPRGIVQATPPAPAFPDIVEPIDYLTADGGGLGL